MSVGLLPFSAQVDNTNAVWLGAVARGGEIDRSIETARADKSKYVTQSSQTPGRTDSPGAQMTPTQILGSGSVFGVLHEGAGSRGGDVSLTLLSAFIPSA